MITFYTSYIQNFAQIAFPLTELTKLKQANKIVFNDVQRDSFVQLKELLCKCTSLTYPRLDRPFILRTDASEYAVGACLSQLDDSNLERPIAFISSKLNDAQKSLAVIEKEAYAVVYALKKFDTIVFASHIDLYTDHNPLQYLASCVPQSSKLTRWSLSLTRYDITVRHIKGSLNVTADCLSRVI